MNHGVKEPVFGVKISELKKFQKQIKRDYELSKELFDTGVYDAQYLAGLIADDKRMSKRDLRHWLAKSNCATVCGFTVAAVAAGSPAGYELALEWIDSPKVHAAQAGWAALSGVVAVTDDSELDMAKFKQILRRVEGGIHRQPNLVRYAMNNFVISVAIYVRDLTELALRTAETIGPVSVDMGNTACEVPFAPEYIERARKRGVIGKKRKTMKC
jgi:3-methyladenine DNA glycosylase AlkD